MTVLYRGFLFFRNHRNRTFSRLVLAIVFALGFVILKPLAIANIVGSDAQNFAPTQDGLDFVTVHSSEVLEKNRFNLGLFFNYAQNSFPTDKDSSSDSPRLFSSRRDSLQTADVNFAYGLGKGFEVGASFPYIIDQTTDSSKNMGSFNGHGFSEYRFMAKKHLFDYSGWGFATIASANFNRIKNNPYVGY